MVLQLQQDLLEKFFGMPWLSAISLMKTGLPTGCLANATKALSAYFAF